MDNSTRWKQSSEFQGLMRQMACDIYVGHKNGVPVRELQKEVRKFTRSIYDSFGWHLWKYKKPLVKRAKSGKL